MFIGIGGRQEGAVLGQRERLGRNLHGNAVRIQAVRGE